MTFESTPVDIDGVTKTVKEWAEERNLKLSTISSRRSRGDSWVLALRKPERKSKKWRFYENRNKCRNS